MVHDATRAPKLLDQIVNQHRGGRMQPRETEGFQSGPETKTPVFSGTRSLILVVVLAMAIGAACGMFLASLGHPPPAETPATAAENIDSTRESVAAEQTSTGTAADKLTKTERQRLDKAARLLRKSHHRRISRVPVRIVITGPVSSCRR